LTIEWKAEALKFRRTKGNIMRTISITEAKKGLGHLAESEQSFRLTSRGHEMATFRVFVQPKFDQDKARELFDKFKASRTVKPKLQMGATASVRALRDGA
jgi:hypothetical protein